MIRTSILTIVATLATFSACTFLPESLVLWTVFPLGLLAGGLFPKSEKSRFLPLLCTWLISTLILLALSLTPFGQTNDFPFLPTAAFLTSSIILGLEFRNGDKTAQPSISYILVLAVLIFLGPLAFSGINRFEEGMWAKVLIYGSFGMLFAYKGIALKRTLLLLVPLILLFAMAPFSWNEQLMWLVLLVQPAAACLFLILGFAIVKNQRVMKLIPALGMFGIVVAYILIVPMMMISESWMNVNQPLGKFSLTKVNGQTIDNADIQGKVVWLNLYGTYCQPCMTELPHVRKVADSFKDRSDVAFILVASSQFDTYEKFQKGTKFLEFGFEAGFEKEPNLAKEYVTDGIPVGILIDKQGKVVARKSGFQEEEGTLFEDQLTASIQKLLE